MAYMIQIFFKVLVVQLIVLRREWGRGKGVLHIVKQCPYYQCEMAYEMAYGI